MVGVDKLRVLLRITEEQTALQVPAGVRFRVDQGGAARFEGQIGADGARDMYVHGNLGKSTLVLEFNPSNIASPAGGLCPFDRLPAVLDEALAVVDDELGILVLPEDRLTGVVQRVDVARDWAVREARNMLLALYPLRRSRATRLELHLNPRTAELSGVRVGNKTSHTKLYIRQGAHPEFPQEDWLRFETQARDSWLPYLLPVHERGRTVLVRDLTPDNLGRLLRDRWQWSQFGVPVRGESQWWVRAREVLPLSQLRALAAWLYAVEHGQDLYYSKETIDNFHKALASIGLPAPGPPRRLRLQSDTPRSRPVPRTKRDVEPAVEGASALDA